MDVVTSTPIVNDKLIPPPPRKLWGNDSVTEQLYQNKWSKYRNSVEEKDSWSQLDAPEFVDFENIPEPRDSFFDHPIKKEKFVTPQRTLAKRLPGVDLENNNILEALDRCALSAIKKCDEEIGNGNKNLPQSNVAVNLINELLDFSNKSSNNNSTLKTNQLNDQESMDIEAPKPPDDPESKNIVKEEHPSIENSQGKSPSITSSHCTITEPFSFEFREKYKQEHRQARRERDSAGKEVWKGFRANPVPSYLKLRNKNKLPATIEEKKPSATTSDKNKLPAIPREKNALLVTKLDEKKKKITNVETYKFRNAAEIWKKKAFEPSHPKRASIQSRPPQLFTAIRAQERQRFEERIREKERECQAILKKEEDERKKREAEEIAKLRKELVHKAQPIRKYKLIVPRVEKRPLADPTTPITCKRRRKL